MMLLALRPKFRKLRFQMIDDRYPNSQIESGTIVWSRAGQSPTELSGVTCLAFRPTKSRSALIDHVQTLARTFDYLVRTLIQ